MAAALVASAVGQGISLYGQYKADQDEAAAYRKNAEWAQQVAEYNALSGQREEDLFQAEVQQVLGSAEAAFNKAGVDMSGSALVAMADTMSKGQAELEDIRLRNKMKIEESQFQIDQMNEAAKQASDPMNTLLGAAGSGASLYGQYGGSK